MKLINGIYKALILGFILVLSLCLFTNFASEITLLRTDEDLAVQAQLEDEKEVVFKLSLNSNRPKIQERSILSYFRPDRSFSTSNMKLYTGEICPNIKVSQKVFINSLTFKDDFKVEGIQLVASKHSLGTNQMFSGILGLNPMDSCNEHIQDPKAIINVLRQKHKGYTINLPKLIFTSEFKSSAFTKFDGHSFLIEQVGYSSFSSDSSFRGKIDLDSNEIKIPQKTYDGLYDEGFFRNLDITPKKNYIYTDKYWYNSNLVDTSTREAWLKLAEGEIIWLSKWRGGDTNALFSKDVYKIHDENYWSFGLYFLDRFSVSFNIEEGLIYFERK